MRVFVFVRKRVLYVWKGEQVRQNTIVTSCSTIKWHVSVDMYARN